MSLFLRRRVYADAGSAVPVALPVLFTYIRALLFAWGNPSSFHQEGMRAKKILQKARTAIARILEVRTDDVVATSGATEANTLAIVGTYRALKEKGVLSREPELIIGAAEHSSVRSVAESLIPEGVRVITAPLQNNGHIDADALLNLVNENTFLVSISFVQSELGLVEKIRTIAQNIKKKVPGVVFHTDASQAPLWERITRARLGADLITLDGQKMGAPRGIGVLIRSRTPLLPIVFGGGQEFGLRSGTEPVALVAACAHALSRAQERVTLSNTRAQRARDIVLKKVRRAYPEVVLNGDISERIPGNINMWIPGRDAEYLVALLDNSLVSVSSRSACESVEREGYSALRILPDGEKRMYESLRITFLPTVSAREGRRVASALVSAIAKFDKVNK